MADLIIYAAIIGMIVTLVMIGISILLALAIKRLLRQWTVSRISALASSFGPLIASAFAVAVMIDINRDDTGLSGPQAQGLILLAVVFIIVIGPGWWLGNWAVRKAMAKADSA